MFDRLKLCQGDQNSDTEDQRGGHVTEQLEGQGHITGSEADAVQGETDLNNRPAETSENQEHPQEESIAHDPQLTSDEHPSEQPLSEETIAGQRVDNAGSVEKPDSHQPAEECHPEAVSSPDPTSESSLESDSPFTKLAKLPMRLLQQLADFTSPEARASKQFPVEEPVQEIPDSMAAQAQQDQESPEVSPTGTQAEDAEAEPAATSEESTVVVEEPDVDTAVEVSNATAGEKEAETVSDPPALIDGHQMGTVTPTMPPIEVGFISEMSVRMWRIEKQMEDRLQKARDLTADFERLNRQFRGLRDVLVDSMVDIREYTGQVYDDGLSVTVIKFIPTEGLEDGKELITETIKPSIFYQGTLIARGEVIVAMPVSSEPAPGEEDQHHQ